MGYFSSKAKEIYDNYDRDWYTDENLDSEPTAVVRKLLRLWKREDINQGTTDSITILLDQLYKRRIELTRKIYMGMVWNRITSPEELEYHFKELQKIK